MTTAGVPAPVREARASRSRLEEVLRAGGFAVTAELAPPDSADPEDVLRRAAVFDGWVDGLNATDGPGAHPHMSSVGVSALLVRAGYSPVMQMACRDRNRIAIQGDILGAAALGIGAVLCLTGDSIGIGDHPEAKPVFDLGAVTLLGAIRQMRDDKRFLSGRALTAGPSMFLGATENPFAPPHDLRPLRMRQKIEAGARFIQTQYCFDVALFERFMARVRDLGLHERAFILAGVGPLASVKAARWIRAHVPGVRIPDEHIRRLEQAAKPAEEGRRLCVELMQRIREIEGVSGVHMIAPHQERYVGEMIAASGVLGRRRPGRAASADPVVCLPSPEGGQYP
ncbi:MAG: methylenetetrahydrofolate reductase [Rhodospirillales bacterium]|nr:methylenetetrahydrofolate reductase [Rhodospirillales bacterium]